MSKIKAIRELLELTQEQLGDGIGCSQANIWQIESNGQELLPEKAKKLIELASKHGLKLSFDHVYGQAPLPRREKSAAQAAGR